MRPREVGPLPALPGLPLVKYIQIQSCLSIDTMNALCRVSIASRVGCFTVVLKHTWLALQQGHASRIGCRLCTYLLPSYGPLLCAVLISKASYLCVGTTVHLCARFRVSCILFLAFLGFKQAMACNIENRVLCIVVHLQCCKTKSTPLFTCLGCPLF